MSDQGQGDGAPKRTVKDQMPLTHGWLNEQRERFGRQHVNNAVRAGLAGERNQFYAVEAGHVLGTPFDWTDGGLFIISMSVLTGAKFVAGIRDPKGALAMKLPPVGDINGTN